MTAASPEELDTLLEDALLMNDGPAVAALFAGTDVFVASPGRIRHGAEATDLLAERGYLASPYCVLVAPGVALGVGDRAVSVSSRGTDGRWRLLAVVVPIQSP